MAPDYADPSHSIALCFNVIMCLCVLCMCHVWSGVLSLLDRVVCSVHSGVSWYNFSFAVSCNDT